MYNITNFLIKILNGLILCHIRMEMVKLAEQKKVHKIKLNFKEIKSSKVISQR